MAQTPLSLEVDEQLVEDGAVKVVRSERKKLLEDFFDEVGLFTQIHQASRKDTKAFWWIVAVLTVGALVMGMGMVFRQFASQEILTTVKFVSPDRFPNILICPQQFIDESKMIRHGFNKSDYEVFGGMFGIPLRQLTEGMTGTSSILETHPQIRSFIQKFRRKFRTIDDFIRETSLEWFQLGLAWIGESHDFKKVISVHNIVTERGMCYRVVQDVDFVLAQDVYIGVNMTIPTAFGYGKTYGMTGTAGCAADALSYVAGPLLPTRMQGLIHLKATGFHRVADCKKWQRADNLKCIADVTNTFCTKNGYLPFYFPNDNRSLTEVSTSFSQKGNCNAKIILGRRELANSIKKQCPNPCNEWIYDATLFDTGQSVDSTILHFKMPTATSSIVIQEVYAFTLANVVCDIGGLFGLWIGASVVTVIQALAFCISRLFCRQ